MKVIVVDTNGTPHKVDGNAKPDFTVLARWTGNRYLVLASNNGDLFDPLSSDNVEKRDRERGGMFWNMKTCSQECYQQYTIFLRSKNRTPYFAAQRRFLNDSR